MDWKTSMFRMIRRITLIVACLFFSFVCFSQIHDTSWTRELQLQTANFIKPNKRIALFESDSFIIYSTFDFVVASIKKSIEENNIKGDSLLLDMFFNTSRSLDRNLRGIQNNKILKLYLDFKTMDLIRRRECLVYNKISKKFETKIFVMDYVKNLRTGVRFLNQSNQRILDLLTGVF
jgi:hypothetical protein